MEKTSQSFQPSLESPWQCGYDKRKNQLWKGGRVGPVETGSHHKKGSATHIYGQGKVDWVAIYWAASSCTQREMLANTNFGYKLACFGRLWWRLGRFSDNQIDLPNIGLVFEFGNWSKIRANSNDWGSLNSQIDLTKYIASKKTEVLETIEGDETNDSKGPIESLEGRETLDLI